MLCRSAHDAGLVLLTFSVKNGRAVLPRGRRVSDQGSIMTIRSRLIAAALLGAAIGATGASAGELISPASVLAETGRHRGAAGFSDRTARLTSIMGPELGRPALGTARARPLGRAAIRRDADAAAGLR